MSSCMSGGGRAYRLDIDIIKSPSNSWTSYSSSPSSTLTESSNFSTRKPRTPRKRPNQTYNEAAAILSTAYPKIFPTTKSRKSYNHSAQNPLLFDPTSDLITPFQVIIDTSEFLLHHQPPPNAKTPPVEVISSFEKQCQSPGDIEITSCQVADDYRGDFDAESILDEEIGEGIDSIMGNLDVENESQVVEMSTCYGYPVGFEFGDGMRSEIRATRRNVDEEGDWWRFPSVVNFVTATHNKTTSHKNKKKKKKKKVDDIITNSEIKQEAKLPNEEEECVVPQLLLKLNYDDVLKAWSDKDSPFSGDAPGAQNDVQARLAQIDLFSENGVREASVLRYKEKRRTRLFSKKIRYQVRKVNADRRPRMKGRFVRNPNSPDNEQG